MSPRREVLASAHSAAGQASPPGGESSPPAGQASPPGGGGAYRVGGGHPSPPSSAQQASGGVTVPPDGRVSHGAESERAMRALDPLPQAQEANEEARLRPRSLSEFIGQSRLKEHLQIVFEAARRRGQPVDHLLFAGPPGLGKTSLAGIAASEMGVGLRVTSGPALVRGGDLAAILTALQEGDVLFIDEIHRLPHTVGEVLYPAMEEFQIDIVIGKGPTARAIRLELPRFTLVGATTRTGLLAGPLRDRFGFVSNVDYYEPAELEDIVQRAASILKVDVDRSGGAEIARRARGTPRIANRLLRRVRDFAEVRGDGRVDLDIARRALELFGVDERGLDHVDRGILRSLCERFSGRPVGLVTLAHSVGEEPDTIEDVYEPYLLRSGLIQRTSRGRLATPAAWAHLGLSEPAGSRLL